ncbi:putative acetyl-coenzyme a synthetase [Neospora caninum Liverpool]|uniref:Acetyl-coenzyme a synthetase, putative n=1 Tax=Neospora caninum (strain Liverpool) TaxID=572307 RepID=F0VIA6_NEOCL|nr:putative acetyl-coenzyme a synthetase [Neospora caninum Liverpool]CBZ53467.1 putative acetyl-coenzyme a synthetase [Neospora caninum Liverpool]CEL67454.1 TPA: acetyl-coenzyme a synthetase, putative [Neospora caninum Liverpool]|eukprot:XP_003883499.1 putative acetyl-coenzyme a synthetase [Neospora caninum Liverpool]
MQTREILRGTLQRVYSASSAEQHLFVWKRSIDSGSGKSGKRVVPSCRSRTIRSVISSKGKCPCCSLNCLFQSCSSCLSLTSPSHFQERQNASFSNWQIKVHKNPGWLTSVPDRQLSVTHGTRSSFRYFASKTHENDDRSECLQDQLHRESLEDPIVFWRQQASTVHWFKPFSAVLDGSDAPIYRWFPGGQVNACYEAVDSHVLNGRAGAYAIIYDSPATGAKEKITYGELLERVSALADALQKAGVHEGDRVLIYMPVVPEAAISMLACARIGAVHAVTFGGFGTQELSTRIDHAKPKAIIAASCGIEPRRIVAYKEGLEHALQLSSHKPQFKVILQRPQHECTLEKNDVGWDSFIKTGSGQCDARPVNSNHPLYLLYTSGTTGDPKGIVRDHAGQCVSSHYTASAVYGIKPGDTIFCASDLGWVLGHSIMLYGALIGGGTSVMYEGKPIMAKDAGVFWRISSEYGVSKLFTAPSALRGIRVADPHGERLKAYDLSGLQTVYLVGERTDHATLRWFTKVLEETFAATCSSRAPPRVIDHWWQSETGWPMTCIMTGQPFGPNDYSPCREGSCGKPCPGWDLRILDNDGEEVEDEMTGHIAVKLPMPPGSLKSLYENDDRYVSTYLSRFPGYYDTGDSGFFDDDGYLHIEGRTDDVINVSAHRISSLSIEEVLTKHPEVAAAVVVGVTDAIKGHVPVAVVVLHPESPRQNKEEQQHKRKRIIEELVHDVRERIGPFACFRSCVIVEKIPHTRSGKTLRKTITLILEGHRYSVPPTIDDPSALSELQQAVKEQLGVEERSVGHNHSMWRNGYPVTAWEFEDKK